MAHSASAKKRIRQNLRARARNRWRLKTLRTAVKAFDEKIAHGSVEEATEDRVFAADPKTLWQKLAPSNEYRASARPLNRP